MKVKVMNRYSISTAGNAYSVIIEAENILIALFKFLEQAEDANEIKKVYEIYEL